MEMRARLLNAAARVFAETGYRGATTRRIAQEAGVNEVTLFRHFGSKADLVQAALQHFSDVPPPVSLPAEPTDPERELTTWACGNLRHLCGVRALIRAAMGETGEHVELASCGSEHPRRAARQLKEYLVALRALGLATEDFEPVTATAMLLGTLFSDAMGRDLMPDVFPLSPERAAESYVRLFLNAIGVRAAARSESAGQSN